MSDYDLLVLERHRGRAVLLDSNLLLLLLVGEFDSRQINRFKRTSMFTEEDYFALNLIVKNCGQIVTTPNILTEVNSFANQWATGLKSAFFTLFVSTITVLEEQYLPSKDIAQTPEASRFGLTDAGVFMLAKRGYVVLTIDAPLAHYLQSAGVDAINFNHFRNYV